MWFKTGNFPFIAYPFVIKVLNKVNQTIKQI